MVAVRVDCMNEQTKTTNDGNELIKKSGEKKKKKKIERRKQIKYLEG